jgi:hypothetical protein
VFNVVTLSVGRTMQYVYKLGRPSKLHGEKGMESTALYNENTKKGK